jgi:hypothetical protein
MTNAMVVYERMAELQTAANAMHASGYFGDVKSQAQAMVKVLAGAEIGLPPFASMSGIHIVNGKPTLGANLIATLVKNDPRYDYRVKRADNEACVLAWYEGGAAVGESSFSIQEANAAGLTGKQTWKAYASDMLFARALTRGARRYAPGIFGGAPIYTPDEMGVDTDEDGHIVQGEIVNVTPPAAPRPAQQATDSGPLPDDELTIEEAPAAKFIPTAAALLETDTDTLKARLKALGYGSIPGKPAERVAAYRRLRADMGAADDLMAVAAAARARDGRAAGDGLSGLGVPRKRAIGV